MAEAAQTVDQDSQVEQQAQVHDVEFSQLDSETSEGNTNSIDILLDMEVPVTVVIGKAQMTVQKLLQLGPGSVMELGKSIESPVELYLKDNKFATGRVVVVDNCFAVKVEQIIGKADANQSK